MNIVLRAQATVARAEAALQALTAEAAAEGDYDTVQLLADWGKQLLHLRASGPELPESSTNSPQPHARPGGRQASRKKGPKGAYPRFDRAGEILIKTSWSKKHKKEYQHKAPGAVLSTLLLAFDRAGARNRPITTEAIFPLIADDQSELPSYQAYLALACLKKANAVESRGRDGYQLRIGTRKPRAVAEELWAALPSAK